MTKEYLSAYLDGLLNMASSLSKSIGPSFVQVDCYDKKEFNKLYKIDYSPTTLTYEDKLKEWFIDEPLVIESIVHWTQRFIKEDKKIYEVNSNDLEKFEKYTLFYTVEDMFILETKKYLITFIIGNDE